MTSVYEKLSNDRKIGQQEGLYPEWYTTGSYQMFKYSYEYQANGLREQLERISKHLAKYSVGIPEEDDVKYGEIGKRIRKYHGKTLADAFFSVMWKNHFQLSTPALANTGTDRGCSISCSGTYVDDAIEGFYDAAKEIALLSKNGFGTSCNLGNIRSRGSSISGGGKATGSSMPRDILQHTATKVSQGGVRRGVVATYLNVDHGDFDEWCDNLRDNPAGQNIGWNFTESFINSLGKSKDSRRRLGKVDATRMMRGKGYIWKPDTVNALQPVWYPRKHTASNLCTEITLYADKDESYSCIISSIVATLFYELKDQASVFLGVMILDAIANEFIENHRDTRGLEKVVRYTENWKSLGLGCLGFASLLQEKMVSWNSLEANKINTEIFSHLQKESILASEYIYDKGKPALNMVGWGRAHSHLVAIAPNLSSSILAGQQSQGIEPFYANVFMQDTASGTMARINPQLLNLMKKKGMDIPKVTNQILANVGSIQGIKGFTEEECEVFATAFEIPQDRLIDLASARSKYIDQWQSLNTFFSSSVDPKYVARITQRILLDPNIKGAYYCRSESGVRASENTACVACAS